MTPFTRLVGITAVMLCAVTNARAGFFGHVAAYATGAVVAHEAVRYIDRREDRHANAGSGAYGNPESAALPNPRLTPGALNPAVTQATIDATICRRGGYTKSIRPDEHYTEQIKRDGIRQYGYNDRRLGDYEEDHLISLELGGSPDSPANLWPEPHRVIGGWGSYTKDKLENLLHRMVCRRQISLADAQRDIAVNWVRTYQHLMGTTPNGVRR